MTKLDHSIQHTELGCLIWHYIFKGFVSSKSLSPAQSDFNASIRLKTLCQKKKNFITRSTK